MTLRDDKKISFRPGTLAGPLAEWCEKNGETPSGACRIALAKLLKVDAPEMLPGNPDASRETALAANSARWKKTKKSKRKKKR